MSLKDKITDDMKTYMREKNKIALEAVRMLKSEIKYVEIEKGAELNDDDVIKVVASAIKKRKDAAQQYRDAARPELAEKEESEIEFLSVYMPEQLSEDVVRKIVTEAVKGVDVSDKRQFGLVMKKVMEKTKGQADGKLINQLVKDVFDGNN
jgi:uncharacterized protein YqeY